MAEYHNQQEEAMKTQDYSTPVETTGDRGLFDFTKKKDEEKFSSEFEEKAMASETNQENQLKSSEEEGCEDEEKKKKSIKDKIKEKLPGDHNKQDTEVPVEEKKSIKDKIKEKLPGDHNKQDTEVPIEKIHVEEEEVYSEACQDKLPGHQGGDYVATPPTTPATVVEGECTGAPAHEERKGFLDKIKDKIPVFHSKTPTDTTTCEEEKEKAKE